MKHALIRNSDSLVVSILSKGKRRVEQRDPAVGPFLRIDSPPVGWQDDTYRIVAVSDAEAAPADKRVASRSHAYDAALDSVVETVVLEDRPVRRVLVPKWRIIDRLQQAGLLEAARAAIDAADLYVQERWNSRTHIYTDDPTAIAFVMSIGGDPAIILARDGDDR